MKRLLAIVGAFIVYGSLYPFRFDFGRSHVNPLLFLLHSWPARMDPYIWRDASVNVLVYFPLGVTAALVFMRRRPPLLSALATVILGTSLSAACEMLQIYEKGRICSLLDVACNFAGVLGGVCAALVFRQEIYGLTRRQKGDRGAGGALMLAGCWAGYQLYPFLPVLRAGYLRANVARFLATRISPVEFTAEVVAGAAEWFAFALVLRAVARRLSAPWLLLTMFCLPLRLLIMERTLAPAEALAAGLGMMVWTYPTESPRLRAGAGALAACILLRELSPFRFTAQEHAMSWIPFAATLGAERLDAALALMRKAFDYGTLVWLLRASGLRYASAGAWVGAGLLVLEVAQMYQPNRQPEITDTVIAAIFACILWGGERRVKA